MIRYFAFKVTICCYFIYVPNELEYEYLFQCLIIIMPVLSFCEYVVNYNSVSIHILSGAVYKINKNKMYYFKFISLLLIIMTLFGLSIEFTVNAPPPPPPPPLRQQNRISNTRLNCGKWSCGK